MVDPTHLAVALHTVVRQHLPHLSTPAVNGLVQDLLAAVVEEFTQPTPGATGRVARYPDRDLVVRYQALCRELALRYKARGIWPDTKSKWDAATEPYLQGWWSRRAVDELGERRPQLATMVYPAEEITRRLSPRARKKEGSLVALAVYLMGQRYELPPETLRSVLRRVPGSRPSSAGRRGGGRSRGRAR